MSQVNYNPSSTVNTTLPVVQRIDIRAYDAWYWEKLAHIPTKQLNPSVKLTVGAIAHEMFRKGSKLTQMTTVWYPNIADWCGLHPKGALQDNIKFLAKIGAIVKEESESLDAVTHAKKTHVAMAFTWEFLDNPGIFVKDVNTNWGGGGRVPVECPHCHEYHSLKKRTTITCTGCGSLIEELTKVITLDNEAPKPEIRTDEEKQVLARLDELIEATDKYYDAAEIDDDAVEAMGGAEKALAASPREIAKVMAVPYVTRVYGVDEEDMDTVWDVMDDMKKVIPFPQQQQQDKPTGKKSPTDSDNPSLFDAM